MSGPRVSLDVEVISTEGALRPDMIFVQIFLVINELISSMSTV